ncbi:MAG: zinc ABC transporter substrate-binding protein [Rikenellaceae bacterium]|nr:zinc ABC transporter substrate-binding protein [Rikenellaceae bacterium]
MSNKLLLILCLSLIVNGCKPKVVTHDIITVSIQPLKFFIEEIAGEDFEINIIVPPGIESETFEPLPSQARELSLSKIYFELGLLEFESILKNGVLFSLPNLQIVNLSENLKLIDDCSSHDHMHPHKHYHDPHIWLSPINMKIFAARIASELSLLNPDQAFKYKQNADSLAIKIDSLNIYIKETFRDLPNRDILVYHPFLGYYCKEYDLQMHSIEHEGKEPSVRYLKELHKTIDLRKITTIFYQKENNFNTIKAICEETEINPVVLDPLAYNWIDNMYAITDEIGKSLQE